MVQINTDRLELRVMELEDAVQLLTTVARTLNEMVGNLNEVSKTHTALLSATVRRLECLVSDAPPWSSPRD